MNEDRENNYYGSMNRLLIVSINVLLVDKKNHMYMTHNNMLVQYNKHRTGTYASKG